MCLAALFFLNVSSAQYFSYDGANIHFGNDSQIAVFTCNGQNCYPGFANVEEENGSVFPYARPISDDFINFSINYSFLQGEACAMKFISQSPLTAAPTQDSSIVALFNNETSFAIISAGTSASPFFLDVGDGQACIGVQNPSGAIEFFLASPQWVAANLDISNLNASSQQNMPQDAPALAAGIAQDAPSYEGGAEAANLNSLPANENNGSKIGGAVASQSEKEGEKGIQLNPQYIAMASGLIFLITLIFALFSRKKKPKEDLPSILAASDKTQELGVVLVDQKKVREAEKVLHDMLETE
ncbi:MAG: hypothetical protein V1822_00835 [Candidatus Micrarchaeota archaeon]